MGFLGMLQQACAGGNAVYTKPMSKMILIATGAVLLLAASCQSTDTGHREFIPGKGWVPVKAGLLGR